MKFSKRNVAAAAMILCSAGSVLAAPVSGAIPAGPVLFSDNSAETLIDRNGNGTLDVGDSLRGIFSIDNIAGSGPAVAIGAGTGFNELSGIFQTVVTSKTAIGGGRFNFTFGFDAAFGQGAGVVGVLREDSSPDFRRGACTIAQCEATATDGALWATFGIGAGGFWSAVGAPDTTAVGALLPLTTPLGSFAFGLDFITNNTGSAWNKVACADLSDFSLHLVDFCGQGGILASGRAFGATPTDTPYDIFDNVDFTANRVPEPTSVALLGLALLGLGVARRKQNV